jgi:hypothetical protein
LKQTYAAVTYGDLDRLLVDLPKAERSQLVPPPPQAGTSPQPRAAAAPAGRAGIPRWIVAMWSSWITVSLIINAIWLATVLNGGGGNYWPVWVMLPWGAVLLASTITGLAHGNGQARLNEKTARRQERYQRRQERRGY